MDEATLMDDKSHHAVAYVGGPVGSDPSSPPDGFWPSRKLRARIGRLAHQRIDLSYIDCKDDLVYHGGHATVSKGTVVPKYVSLWDSFSGNFFMGIRGMGRWFEHKLDVAIKKMRVADDTDFEQILGLTIREAEFLAELHHSNIVKLEGFVEDVSKGVIWLVFPWAEYGNLKDFIARDKWYIPERISLISDVAMGLEYLHTQTPPICHGDLKSLNVLIYGDGDSSYRGEIISARITDFGSARRLPQSNPNTQIKEMFTQLPSAQPLSAAFCASTKTITLTGNKYTLRWAAPELLLQDQLSLSSDIWSLGWIAYEVMTGYLPFEEAVSEMAVVERILEGKLPSLTDNANLSLIHELCSLMSICWNIQPTQRPTAAFCRRSIDKMPRFTPTMQGDERILDYHMLHELGQMYQSRGEYARAFTVFVNVIKHDTTRFEFKDRIQALRDLAQLARLREQYCETISVYDVIWEIYEESHRKDTDGLSDAFYDLAELHRLRKKSEETGALHYKEQDIVGQQRVAEALCAMAESHRLEGNHGAAIALNINVLKIRTNLSDRKGRGDALWALAEAYRVRHNYEQAIQLYSEVLEIHTDLNDKTCRASALWGLADVHRRQNKYEQAIPLYSEVLEICTNLHAWKGRADALWGLADVHRRREEHEEAIPLYSDVLEICTSLGDRKGRADALWGLADVHRCRSEHKKAIPLYSEVVEIRTNLCDWKGRACAQRGLAETLWSLAEAHRNCREYEEAIPLYSDVLNIRTDIYDRKGRDDALQALDDVHQRRKKYEEAIPLYSGVLEIRTDLYDLEGGADALWGLAKAHQNRREYKEAIPLYSDVLEIRSDFEDKKGRADALLGLADVHRRRKEYEKAIPLYSEVLKICTDFEDEKGRADALLGLADVHRRRRQYEEAIQLYSQVLKIRTDLEDEKGRADALWGLNNVNRCRKANEEAIPL